MDLQAGGLETVETMASQTIINLEPILPENAHFEVFELAIVAMLNEEMGEVLKLFNKFTSTWTHKPRWKKEIKNRRKAYVGRVSTRSKPFVYVEGGTKIRRMGLSRDFRAKTKVRSLSSGPGQGTKTSFLKRPASGIAARESRFVIEKMRLKPAASNLAKKFNLASKQVFHGGGRNQG